MRVNNFTVSLRVGAKDAVVRETGNSKVLSFSGAYTSPFGEKKTDWYEVSFWGNRAESLAPYITKGVELLVIGRFETGKPWKDRDGNTRTPLTINASDIQLVSRGNASEDSNKEEEEEAVSDNDLF